MDIEVFKKALEGVEGGEALLQFFTKHDETLRTEAKNQRISKGEILKLLGAENKDDAVEKIANTQTELNDSKDSTVAFKELLASMGATNKDDVLDKIAQLETSISTITGERESEKAERIKTEKEKIEALQISEFTKAISDKKVTDENGVMLAAMRQMAKQDDSGQWLIGEQSPIDFLQKQIDSNETMFKTKTTEEVLPGAKDLAADASAREAMGLPPKE